MGRLPNSNFTPGAFAYLGGPLGPFGVQVHKIKFYSGGFFFLGSLPNLNFTPGLLPILESHWGFWGQGLKIRFYFGFLPIVRVPNSNLTLGAFAHLWAQNSSCTPGALPILGANGAFWGSGVPKISANGTRKQTSPAHCAIRVHQFWSQRGVPVIDHQPYYRDLAPANGRKPLKSNLSLEPKDGQKPPRSN
jgi:hypothetical protein